MTKCIELLPCDWLISNLCYQAIKEVYLIKCLVSVYKCVLLPYGIFTDPHDKNVYCRYLKCRKRLNYSLSYMEVLSRDAPVDRPKIGTGRFLLIMRDRQPAGFCLFFGRFFRKCEHVICVEDIRQEHNKHRKTDTMKRTAVGVTLLAHK